MQSALYEFGSLPIRKSLTQVYGCGQKLSQLNRQMRGMKNLLELFLASHTFKLNGKRGHLSPNSRPVNKRYSGTAFGVKASRQRCPKQARRSPHSGMASAHCLDNMQKMSQHSGLPDHRHPYSKTVQPCSESTTDDDFGALSRAVRSLIAGKGGGWRRLHAPRPQTLSSQCSPQHSYDTVC